MSCRIKLIAEQELSLAQEEENFLLNKPSKEQLERIDSSKLELLMMYKYVEMVEMHAFDDMATAGKCNYSMKI